ncbi:MAG TPA: response regulator [Sphingomicrobium sp.]|nr:response regulator [Sphingomicrobium sp.]
MLEGPVDRSAAIQSLGKRAYVVDDDAGFRNSLVVLLGANGWHVEAFDSPQAFVDRSAELDPGLLLLDLNMPGGSGLDLLESGVPEIDRFAVIMVTGAGAIQTAVRTIKAGAIDFIEKPFGADELLERLDSLDSTLGETLRAKAETLDSRRRVASLSPREHDVLERLLGGASNKLIARSLEISPRTVEMHRARMLQKLGVDATAEALDVARRAGLTAVSD